MIRLTLKRQPKVPLEAEVLTPDIFRQLSHAEIRAAKLYHGKRTCRVDDFFEVEGQASETLHLCGDLSRVRWIGRSLSRGAIHVEGNVGMHLGAHMSGGTIEVTGDAGDWVGAEMTGGLIRVHGNAGGQVGAGYRGSLSGMRGGTILVSGTAGLEVGLRMRRGTIVIGKLARDFAGLQMKGGTIVLLGGAEERTGAWMSRGTIISCKPIAVMPTFRRACEYAPIFINVYAQHLTRFGISLPCDSAQGSFSRFTGDHAIPGKGEVLVWQPISVEPPTFAEATGSCPAAI
ncbi:MAG: formylmethanofuran dehydrogenase subunit C [Planctomycetales bacterium]|nr:formylmethanofuran dehydrogenase subunit C [Planctomycetales bacterium]